MHWMTHFNLGTASLLKVLQGGFLKMRFWTNFQLLSSSHVAILATQHGGHIGFMEGALPTRCAFLLCTCSLHTVEWSLTRFSQMLGLYILSSGITTLTESSLSTWKLSLMLIKIHKVHLVLYLKENNNILLIEEVKLSANHFIFNCLKPHSISRYHK